MLQYSHIWEHWVKGELVLGARGLWLHGVLCIGRRSRGDGLGDGGHPGFRNRRDPPHAAAGAGGRSKLPAQVAGNRSADSQRMDWTEDGGRFATSAHS